MIRYCPSTHDTTLRHLFQCGMSDEQIAERMDVSWQAVKRARERLNLGQPAKANRLNPPAEAPPRVSDPNNPMVLARETLGLRITEVNGAYRLDGTPTRFFDLMKETNRILVKQGKTQFGPPDWQVKP